MTWASWARGGKGRLAYAHPSIAASVVRFQDDPAHGGGGRTTDLIAAEVARIRDLGIDTVVHPFCGTGRWLAELGAGAGLRTYVGIDVNPFAVERARRRAPPRGHVEIRCGDVLTEGLGRVGTQSTASLLLLSYEVANLVGRRRLHHLLREAMEQAIHHVYVDFRWPLPPRRGSAGFERLTALPFRPSAGWHVSWLTPAIPVREGAVHAEIMIDLPRRLGVGVVAAHSTFYRLTVEDVLGSLRDAGYPVVVDFSSLSCRPRAKRVIATREGGS